MVLESLKKYFPHNTRTFDDFIETIKKENCSQVDCTPLQECGFGGAYSYSNSFQAQTSTGRKIIYNEFYGFSFMGGFVDIIEDRNFCRTVTTAKDRLDKIKEKLPNLNIKLNLTMDKKDYARMYATVEKHTSPPIQPISLEDYRADHAS